MTRLVGPVWGLLAIVFTVAPCRAVEHAWDYSVQVESAVEVSPPKVTLRWVQPAGVPPISYAVYRKAPGASNWGVGTTLPGTATQFVDADVAVGRAYEYRIVKSAPNYTGYGYVQTGIQTPLIENRGTVVLVIEQTCAAPLAHELVRLEQDMVGDGWSVVRHEVGRGDSVASVKNLIKADYETKSAKVTSVFLFGHVPVPYSGELNPDKHPDHVGAWPADVYYGDMHGAWTDRVVNYRQMLNPDATDAARMSNIPGDGKFDQTTIPGEVELEVGRVDFANLPGRVTQGSPATFPDEVELLRQYLNKDHSFRQRTFAAQRRALIGDYFGVRGGEAFSASGFRSFAPLVGTQAITNLNAVGHPVTSRWTTTLAAQDYLLAYGCGPGSYQSIDGIGATGPSHDGTTVDMVRNDIHAVFTLIYGSWLGDWDHEDDLMRAILAAPSCSLAAAWSGRPHWFLHPMGQGETIGYCTRLTQNNTGLYQNEVNSAMHQIHIALMGDPTLRLNPVAPGATLTGTATPVGMALAWTASPDAVAGYHVYRATAGGSAYSRLTRSLATTTAFIDPSPVPGATYMVRAVKLESTPSGTYYNGSQGIFWDSAEIIPVPAEEPVAVLPRTAVPAGEPDARLPASPPSSAALTGGSL